MVGKGGEGKKERATSFISLTRRNNKKRNNTKTTLTPAKKNRKRTGRNR